MVAVPESVSSRESVSLMPRGTVVPEDELMMLLIPAGMWNEMRAMADEAGVGGPIALINIALERLRRALASGAE
jgi:hypothetical protein